MSSPGLLAALARRSSGRVRPASVRVERGLTRGYLLTLAAACACLALLGVAPSAGAVILPATTIDGPNASIEGFGGVAMAEDGTGGVVYLKKVGGVAHVFVSRFSEGQW